MASATFTHDLAIRSRRCAFFLPREHGAWGMLLVPLAVGAAAGNPPWDRLVWILLFAVAALSLFCLRTPVEAALGLSPIRPQNDGERRLVNPERPFRHQGDRVDRRAGRPALQRRGRATSTTPARALPPWKPDGVFCGRWWLEYQLCPTGELLEVRVDIPASTAARRA